jgi:uncharacterized protein YdeI (YjbR/CyaY-like superfamily)
LKHASAEVDTYIAKSPDFAKPILVHIRGLFHAACPEVTEAIKWGHPFFEYRGILGLMPAFKNSVRLKFWKYGSLTDPQKVLSDGTETEAGSLQVTSVGQLPSDEILIAYIKEAVELNKAGIDIARSAPKKPMVVLELPEDFAAALAANDAASAGFESFSKSGRNEYIEWIVAATQDATRQKRIATAVDQLAEGKSLNWKYQKK